MVFLSTSTAIALPLQDGHTQIKPSGVPVLLSSVLHFGQMSILKYRLNFTAAKLKTEILSSSGANQTFLLPLPKYRHKISIASLSSMLERKEYV
jgi:hypothetical protein